MKRILLLAGALLLGLFPLAAQTDFGYLLDTTFAGTGQVVRNDPDEWRPIKTVLHPDGGFVMLGYRTNDGASVLCRYQPDGTSAPDWGIDGMLTIGDNNGLRIKDLGMLPDGRMVLGGQRPEPNGNGVWATLTRLLPNGLTDVSFGENGFALLPGSLAYGQVQGLAVQDDQRPVVVVRPTNGTHLAVVRFDTTGALEENFGQNGLLQIPIQTTNTESFDAEELLTRDGGPIWVRGGRGATDVVFGETVYVGWIAYLNAGEVTFISPGFSYPRSLAALALLPNDSWLALANDGTGNNPVQVRKYLVGAVPDYTFGTVGVQKISFLTPTSENSYSGQMAVDTAGRILVGVLVFDSAPWDSQIGLARLLPDGDLDTSFGNDGIASFGGAASPGNFTLYELNVLAQPDGKVLLTGLRDPLGLGQNQVFALRLNPDATVSLPAEPTAARRWMAFPNPVRSGEALTFRSDLPADGTRWRLLDGLGRTVGDGTVTGGKVAVPAGCTAGCYYLHLRHADGSAGALPVLVAD